MSWKSFPYYRQLDSMDCGPTCLLESVINAYQIADIKSLVKMELSEDLEVGELNTLYSNLINEVKSLQQLWSQKSTILQIKTIKREINHLQDLNQSLKKEKTIFAEELSLIDKDFNRNKNLNTEKIISDLDLENAEKTKLQYNRQYEAMQSGIIQNNIRKEQLVLQSQQLAEDRKKILENQSWKIKDLITRMMEEIRVWKKTYFIYAEGSGTIALNTNIVNGLSMQAGSSLGFIIPDTENNPKIVRAIVPTQGAGKVEIGDKVILRFNAFPYKEYGSVVKQVGNITAIPQIYGENELAYEVMIPMVDKIITDYGKTIPYSPHLDVSVQIITRSNNILGRIFNELRVGLKFLDRGKGDKLYSG